MIERFNRTIKEFFFKYFTANNTRKFVDVLDLRVDQYNITIHSSIRMTLKELLLLLLLLLLLRTFI